MKLLDRRALLTIFGELLLVALPSITILIGFAVLGGLNMLWIIFITFISAAVLGIVVLTAYRLGIIKDGQ